jgi:hypothetical protein
MKRCLSCWTVWDTADPHCPLCRGLRVEADHTPSPRENELRAMVQARLETFGPRLVEELHGIARASMPAETCLIDFEAQPYRFRYAFAVRWDPMDAELTQLDGGGDLLVGAEPILSADIADAPEYEGLAVASVAFHALPQWFADCWARAGGSACRFPAYLSEHDSSLAFDLRSRTWDVNGARWDGFPSPPSPLPPRGEGR